MLESQERIEPLVDAAGSFGAFSREVRSEVNAHLRTVLDGELEAFRPRGDDVVAIFESARDLCLRGGKRLRAVLVAAAYEACGGPGGHRAILHATTALEILQAYLLIHDDWMDEDDVRRGGPTVHVSLRARFGGARGDACAVLAGNYFAALALRELGRVLVPPERFKAAWDVWTRINQEVLTGQMLDMLANGSVNVESVYDLKTGSYTVRGPLLLGAALAGASPNARAALASYADPLGQAFQLRDDLMGAFGDRSATGKAVGSDIRQGKRTALITELQQDAAEHDLLVRVWGVQDASEDDVLALVHTMRASGARSRVEERLRRLAEVALRRLADAPFEAYGMTLLRGAVEALLERDH